MSISAGIIACLMLAACGGGSDDGGGGTTPPPPPPPPAGIGTTGGTVTETSGAKVVIPSGALTANTDIQVTQSGTGAPALPADVTAIGATYAFTPHGTTFAKPVTVTVPFDPAKLPAGSIPRLFKTDASRAAWQEVPGATVNGAAMTGDVTSFSNLFVGLPKTQLVSVLKQWFVGTRVDDEEEYHFLASNTEDDGDPGAVKANVPFGLNLPFTGKAATAEVVSTQDGLHYHLSAQAPKPEPDVDPPKAHAYDANLFQTYTYRKNAGDATLRFTVTRAQMDTLHPRGTSTFGADQALCPWLDPGDTAPEVRVKKCNQFQITADVGFVLVGWSANLDRTFYTIGGIAGVSGMGNEWLFDFLDLNDYDVTSGSVHVNLEDGDSEVFEPLWDFSRFSFQQDVQGDGGSQARAVTRAPIVVNVPLDEIPVDSVFTIETSAAAETENHVQGESEASAFFQDPVDPDGGVTVEFTGLEPLPSQSIPVTHKPLHPCSASVDPAAGKVRFTAPDFAFPEISSRRAHAVVERVDGSKGEIGVLLESKDDTALAGSDYRPVHRVVWFHDGQSGRRGITLPILPDTVEEFTETAKLELTVVSGCAALGDQPTATFTIYDDDKRPPPPPTFTLGGTLTGLTGTGLHLQTNFINDVSPTADGPFTFPRTLDDGATYSISIVSQPTNPAQICTVTNGSGTIAGANVTNVAVACTTPPPPTGIDTSFGSLGKVFTAFGSVRALTQQADGKLLSLARTSISRFNTDGTPDTTFGTGGKVDLNTGGGSFDEFYSFVVQPDGKIVAAGEFTAPTVPNDDWVMYRFNPDGSLDTGFGSGGRVQTDFGGHFDSARAVMLTSGGGIVVAGYAQLDKVVNVGTVPIQIIDQDFAVVRYLPDGSLDATYGTGGKATLDAGGVDYLNAAVLAADGSVFGVGRVHESGADNPDMGVAKFLNNGIGDPTFGTGGVDRIDVATGVVPANFTGGLTDEALDVELDGSEILVAGYEFDSSNKSHGALLRLSAVGAIVHNFGPAIPSTIDRVNAIALDGSGIVVAGTGQQDFGIAMLTKAGGLDATFGTQGLLTVDFFGANDFATAALVQADGRIVVGGTARNGTTGGAGLVRVN